jgi:hypothetical protein
MRAVGRRSDRSAYPRARTNFPADAAGPPAGRSEVLVGEILGAAATLIVGIATIGRMYGKGPTPEDIAFIERCKLDPADRPWRPTRWDRLRGRADIIEKPKGWRSEQEPAA